MNRGFLSIAFFAAMITTSCGVLSKKDNEISKRGHGGSSTLKSWEQPDEAFRIGRGYDPDAVEQIRGDCLKDPEELLTVTWKDAQGIKASLSETLIQSHEDLLKELNFSMSAAGSYAFYKASMAYSRYDKFASSTDTFTWYFGLMAEAGSRTLKTEKIDINRFTDQVQNIIARAQGGDANAKKEFRKLCGTQFVRGVRLGGKINDVVEISAKAVDILEKVYMDMHGSAGAGPWKASMSAHFDSFLKDAAQRSMLKRELTQEGGDRINYDMKPENVQATLDAFAKSITHENAVVLDVELVDWETVLSWSTDKVANTARQVKLEELLRQIWGHKAKWEKIDKYLYLYENNSIVLTKDQVDSLRKKHVEIDNFITRATRIGESCFVNSDKCSEAIDPVVVDFPSIINNNQINWKGAQLTDWRLDLPKYSSPLRLDSPGDKLTAWTVNPKLDLETAPGQSEQVELTLSETRDCPSIVSLFPDENKDRILVTDRGEKLFYTETQANLPATGGKVFNITFGYKKADKCLLLQFYQNNARNLFSLEDDVEASRVIRKIAQGVRTI